MQGEAQNQNRVRRFVLPPLDDDHGLAGERETHGLPVLATIAAGLKVANLRAQTADLVSVPDVWAQVEVFRAALFDSRHPLHPRAEGEWRGLLAMFALRYARGYDVATDVLDLPDPTPNGEDRGLMAILGKIKPAVALPRTNWNEIGLIRVHGNVVGMLVPTTIVCPARRPPAALVGRLPWIAADRILDPLTVAAVSGEEIAVLAQFCHDASALLAEDPDYGAQFARQNLYNPDDAGRSLLARLKIAFDNFERDARNTDKLKRLRSGNGQFRSQQLHLNLPKDQPFYPLLSTVKVRGPSESDPISQTLLLTRPELSAVGLNGIIIIDPDLPRTFGAGASEINVWHGVKLQQVQDHPTEYDKVVSEAKAAGYLCLRPDDLLTTYFYRTETEQTEAQPAGFKDALLPVTPAVMMLLSPEDLRHSIQIATGFDNAVVTLSIKLSPIGGRERYYTLRKSYDADDIISREPPTTLAFWPDFEHQDWHWHFAYFGGRLTQQFSPRMLVSMPAMAAFIAAAGENPAARVDRARQLVDEPHLLADRLPLRASETPVELYKSAVPAEALYCDFVMDLRTRGFVESRARIVAGMLLLPVRKKQQRPDACAIAIDFGTVNTSVYQRIGAGEPEPIVFKNRLMLPYAADSEEKEITVWDFLQFGDIPIPFLTVLRDREVPRGTETLPIWTSVIYYDYVIALSRGLEYLEAPGGLPLRFDLKWGETPEDRLPMRTFLAQVALQALAEVVARGIAPGRVKWRFSYPEAYSPTQRRDFGAAARLAAGRATSPNDEAAPPALTTDSESLSTALYFMKAMPREAPATGDLVTIDMGGLTSDVSIWHSRRLIWRNSLKLAGRHILIRYLLKYPDLVGRMASIHSEIAPLIDRVMKLPDAARGNGIEMLLNSTQFQKMFVDEFNLLGGDALGRRLRGLAELALLGILHYVGRTMQYCAKHSNAYRVSNAHVAVCIGGRASMLYHALFSDNGDASLLEPSMGAFRDAAPGLVHSTRIVYTDPKRAKHEVAYGLLVDQQGQHALEVDAEDYRVKAIILGEAVRSGETQLPPDSLVTGLGAKPEWEAAGLNEIKSFLTSLEKHSQTIVRVQLGADAERAILNQVRGQLVTDRQTLQTLSADGTLNDEDLESESTVIEPPFIVALRELVALVIDGKVPVQMRI
jgi:hypothetical protein